MDEEKKYLLAVIRLYAKLNLYLTSGSVMDRTDSKPFHFILVFLALLTKKKPDVKLPTTIYYETIPFLQ